MASTRTQGRRATGTLRQGRFGRAGEPAEASRRFGRGPGLPSRGGITRKGRHRQPDQGGAQNLVQGLRGALPGGGSGSSAKRGKRSSRSIPVVGGLLTSLSGRKGGGTSRGRKPAVLGLLGAGAAGAAALAKRRKGSGSSQASAVDTKAMSEAQTASTPAPRPDTPAGDQPG